MTECTHIHSMANLFWQWNQPSFAGRHSFTRFDSDIMSNQPLLACARPNDGCICHIVAQKQLLRIFPSFSLPSVIFLRPFPWAGVCWKFIYNHFSGYTMQRVSRGSYVQRSKRSWKKKKITTFLYRLVYVKIKYPYPHIHIFLTNTKRKKQACREKKS